MDESVLPAGLLQVSHFLFKLFCNHYLDLVSQLDFKIWDF